MCDTYGATGTKLEIDIEELDNKAQNIINSELEKPKLQDALNLKPLIEFILSHSNPLNEKELANVKRKYKFNNKRSYLFQAYLMLVETANISIHHNPDIIRETCMIKAVKSWSGICNVTIFTSPFPTYTDDRGNTVTQKFSCGKNCSFCPNEPGMPKSYLTLEPATLRAKRNDFDCVRQMYDRMNSLYVTGHGSLCKIEVCILGGTFSHYPNKYREEFVRDVYYAANTFWERESPSPLRPRASLDDEKHINDYSGKCKVVQIVIETRPDAITSRELKFLRYLSVTRVQLGIQHLDDDILSRNNRDCSTQMTIIAIEQLKMIGMKIDGHFMPNMPYSTVEKDRTMLESLIGLNKNVRREIKYNRTWTEFFRGLPPQEEHWEYYDVKNPQIQVDQLKIYPTAVTVYTDIEKWYKSGEYVPYDESHLVDMLLNFKSMIFPWLRLNRIMRDFYADNIFSISGSNLNMRSELHKMLGREGKYCMCIRCREAKLNKISLDFIYVVREYNASNGTEYFISAESRDNKILYGFVRLRLDVEKNKIFHELNGAALLREAHVYSTATDLGQKGKVQHQGLGTRLMIKAEKIARHHGYKKMAVISAVGSRGFYRKLGYTLYPSFGEYMLKDLLLK